jgi:methylated-DNA-[protein]-cysteine S-methyltransferase
VGLQHIQRLRDTLKTLLPITADFFQTGQQLAKQCHACTVRLHINGLRGQCLGNLDTHIMQAVDMAGEHGSPVVIKRLGQAGQPVLQRKGRIHAFAQVGNQSVLHGALQLGKNETMFRKLRLKNVFRSQALCQALKNKLIYNMHLILPNPLGTSASLVVQFNAAGAVTQLTWGSANPVPSSHPIAAALAKYFKGGEVEFDVVFQPAGTPFQQRVWQALCSIPYGTLATYGDLAEQLGTSPRAVGGAVGANPMPILIPCHRVVGARGALTGYSAPGGLTTKTKLLALEGVAL